MIAALLLLLAQVSLPAPMHDFLPAPMEPLPAIEPIPPSEPQITVTPLSTPSGTWTFSNSTSGQLLIGGVSGMSCSLLPGVSMNMNGTFSCMAPATVVEQPK